MTDTKAQATVTIEIPVTVQRLRDLLCSAVEGGSNYWAAFRNAERTADLEYLKVKVTELDAHEDGVNRINRYVTPEDLAQGIRRLAIAAVADDESFPAAGKHLADVLSGNGDAETADVVLQMTVFHRLIYG